MIAKTRGVSAVFARDQILLDVSKGHFLPGDKLMTVALAKRYQISRTPIREALIQLEREGVVESSVNAGYQLKLFSLEEICDIYEIRELLEGMAVEKLAKKGIAPEQLEKLHKSCLACQNAETIEQRDAADRDFHGMICDFVGSEILCSIIHNYLVLSASFNVARHMHSVYSFSNGRDIHREHSLIVDAITAGNAKLARNLVIKHISQARKRLSKFSDTLKKRKRQI